MLKYAILAVLGTLMTLSSSYAHVTVRNLANGVDSMSGKSDTFRLNVPNNRGKTITSVHFVIPEEVKFLYLQPVPNWQYQTQQDQHGNVRSITYTGKILAGEFMTFHFIARNPATPDQTVNYKAYVTYEDQVVVPFDGSEEAKGYQPRILLK